MESQTGFNPFLDFLRIFKSLEHSQFLLFPKSYTKYYPKPLPETAVLKKPEGTFWTVKWTVTEDGETVSFQDGWKKFIQDNGVIDGDFLLFTYDGSRKFWVQIHRNGLPLKPTTQVNIQEISDDSEAEKTDNGNMEEGDNMIISLSLGTSDELDDDEEEYTSIYEATGSSKKAKKAVKMNPAKKKKKAVKMNDAAPSAARHLDDLRNPFFIPKSSSGRVLVISKPLIENYGLKFEEMINLIDGFGVLKRHIGKWKDRVVVQRWDEMYKRNNVKEGDMIVCEFFHEDYVVRDIKVHIVRK